MNAEVTGMHCIATGRSGTNVSGREKGRKTREEKSVRFRYQERWACKPTLHVFHLHCHCE